MRERSQDEAESAEVVVDWDDEAPTRKIPDEKEKLEQIPEKPTARAIVG